MAPLPVPLPDAARPPAAPARPPAAGPRDAKAPELLLVAAATVLAYLTSLGGSFHFDDLHAVVGNAAVRDPSLLWPPHGARWLGTASFALSRALGGEGVLGFHLANLAIHVGSALLVHRLARAILVALARRGAEAGPVVGRFLPLAASLLFALHPVETQAVTYVVQRFASLATLLYLAALVLYLRARLAMGEGAPLLDRRAGVAYALAVVCAAGAAATKEIAVTLPFVAAIFELVVFRGRPRRLLLVLPLALVALPAALEHQEILGDLDRWVERAAEVPRSAYLLTETRVVATYLRLLVLPAGQSFDWDFPLSRSLSDPRVLAAIALLVSLAALATAGLVRARRARRAEGEVVFLGTAFFFVTLLPESSLVPLRDVLVEHRLYLPSGGALLALATLLLALAERLPLRVSPAARCAAVLLVTAVPLGVATSLRNLVYADEVALWRDAVAKGPGKPRPHQLLGAALLARGELRPAIAELEEALRLEPRYPEALANLGYAHAELGERERAIREYELAIRLGPELAMPHNDLGTLYEEAGRLADAVREYREALRLSPGLPEAEENLARVTGRPPASGR